MTLAKHPPDYLGILLWGKQLFSLDYYIEDQQSDAFHDGAPIDAIYKRHGADTWVCVSDLAPDHPFRKQYEDFIKSQTVTGN